jgi:hypothetical protein
LRRQKLDAETVRSSAHFDTLDTQTQQILQVLVESKEDLPREIIKSIAKMLCRLEAVNQSEHHKTRLLIAFQNSAFGHTPSVGDITAQIEMLDVEDKEEQCFRRSVQKTILESLRYPNMTDRYEDLVEAHPQTFDWVFREPNQDEERPWSSFGQWLREGKGIYWINGKAGSGKSTLMKHIYDDKFTKQFLQDWSCDPLAGPTPCCVATFFFWNSGTDMQKSIQGLLRSLLFQVLGRCPDLIPVVFPTRWASLYATAGSSDLRQEIEPDSFSLRQLHGAFEKMVEQKHIPLKICFLIDGLDEFSGNTMDLCMHFVQLAARSDTAKFCLSSRPWVEFQRSFKVYPSLKLQDLTNKDIDAYINNRFGESLAFNELAKQNETLVSSLAQEISQRAEGVFLWVTIVVNQLLKGINNKDTIALLWERLYGFPRELGPLYDKILSQIDGVYLPWASRAFQIMNASTELSSDPFHKRSQSSSHAQSPKPESNTGLEEGRLQGVNAVTLMEWLFALYYDDEYKVEKSEQLAQAYKDIETHLTARCAGLLEVSTLGSGEMSLRPVRWMHRTARDFMNGSVKWAAVFEKEGPLDFSPHLPLMRGSIKSLSMHANSGPDGLMLSMPDRHYGWGANAWFYAYHANGHAASRHERTKLLRLFMQIRTKGPSTILSSVPHREYVEHRRGMVKLFPESDRAFLVQAAMYCLSDFVEDLLLQVDRAGQINTAMTFMKLLCDKERIASTELPFPTVQMISSLINIAQFPQRQLPPMENPENYDSGEDDSGEDASGRYDSGEDDSGEDDSGEDDSGEDDSGEDDSGEDDSGEDDSGQDDDSGEDNHSGEDDGLGEDAGASRHDHILYHLGEDDDSGEDEDAVRHDHNLYQPARSDAEKMKIYPLELWSFFDSQISIIQAFVKAGVDPTNSFTYVPNDFIFRKKELRELLEKKMQQGCEDVNQAQRFLEEAIREEVRQQKESGSMCSKRKLDEVLPSEVSNVSDPLGSEERNFVGDEKFMDRRKRVKSEQDATETVRQFRFA